MVTNSVSILLPTCSFPSNSSANASPTSSTLRLIPFRTHTKPNPRFPTPPNSAFLRCSSRFSKIVALSSSNNQSNVEDGSVELFLNGNSIADFMRFKKGSDRGSGELQTAVVSYRKRFPQSVLQPFFKVDLVSTIHIADKEYFVTLQKALEHYDCVLYEMVASKKSLEIVKDFSATMRLKGSSSKGYSILGCIQRLMARILMLDFQLDCLDYQVDNWYHADLDYETFRLLQFEKGETNYTFARDMTLRSTKGMVQPPSISEELGPLRSKLLWASRVVPMPLVGLLIIGSVCDVASQASEYPELEALSKLDFSAAMKVFLARRLTSNFTQGTADIEQKSVIVGERNRAAMEALRRAIGKGHNRIAILYGGGHMPDLGRRLREELDLIPSKAQWITAWSIKCQDLKISSLPFLKSVAELLGWPLNRYQTLALLIFSSVLAVDLWFWELFFGTTVNLISRIASELYQYVNDAQMM